MDRCRRHQTTALLGLRYSAKTSDGAGGASNFPIKGAVPSKTVPGGLSQFSIGLLAFGSGTPLLTAGVFVRSRAQWENGETGPIN